MALDEAKKKKLAERFKDEDSVEAALVGVLDAEEAAEEKKRQREEAEAADPIKRVVRKLLS